MSSRGEALPSEPAPLSANAPLSASSPPCGEHPRSSDLSVVAAHCATAGEDLLPSENEIDFSDEDKPLRPKAASSGINFVPRSNSEREADCEESISDSGDEDDETEPVESTDVSVPNPEGVRRQVSKDADELGGIDEYGCSIGPGAPVKDAKTKAQEEMAQKDEMIKTLLAQKAEMDKLLLSLQGGSSSSASISKAPVPATAVKVASTATKDIGPVELKRSSKETPYSETVKMRPTSTSEALRPKGKAPATLDDQLNLEAQRRQDQAKQAAKDRMLAMKGALQSKLDTFVTKSIKTQISYFELFDDKQSAHVEVTRLENKRAAMVSNVAKARTDVAHKQCLLDKANHKLNEAESALTATNALHSEALKETLVAHQKLKDRRAGEMAGMKRELDEILNDHQMVLGPKGEQREEAMRTKAAAVLGQIKEKAEAKHYPDKSQRTVCSTPAIDHGTVMTGSSRRVIGLTSPDMTYIRMQVSLRRRRRVRRRRGRRLHARTTTGPAPPEQGSVVPCIRLSQPAYSHAEVSAAVVLMALLLSESQHSSVGMQTVGRAVLPYERTWHVSHREHNRLMHALHGNGILKKIYTNGMPLLSKDSSSPSDYIHWSIALRSWTVQAGIMSLVIGPLPDDVEDDDKAEGLRYLCAAIENQDMKSEVASQGAANGAPAGLAWLEREFLQGVAKQPALHDMFNSMSLQPKENIVTFKSRFAKISRELDPRPSANILCSTFAKAIKQHTGSLYDDCISSASAANDQTDFDTFSALLVKLCTQKRSRETAATTQISDVAALRADMKAMAVDLKKQMADSRPGRHERDTRRDRPDQRNRDPSGRPQRDSRRAPNYKPGNKPDGKKGPPHGRGGDRRQIDKNKKCDFVLPNGERCGKNHLRSDCYYEDPSRCPDPRIREIITKKLASMSTTSSANHSTQANVPEDFEIFCCDLGDEWLEDVNELNALQHQAHTWQAAYDSNATTGGLPTRELEADTTEDALDDDGLPLGEPDDFQVPEPDDTITAAILEIESHIKGSSTDWRSIDGLAQPLRIVANFLGTKRPELSSLWGIYAALIEHVLPERHFPIDEILARVGEASSPSSANNSRPRRRTLLMYKGRVQAMMSSQQLWPTLPSTRHAAQPPGAPIRPSVPDGGIDRDLDPRQLFEPVGVPFDHNIGGNPAFRFPSIVTPVVPALGSTSSAFQPPLIGLLAESTPLGSVYSSPYQCTCTSRTASPTPSEQEDEHANANTAAAVSGMVALWSTHHHVTTFSLTDDTTARNGRIYHIAADFALTLYHNSLERNGRLDIARAGYVSCYLSCSAPTFANIFGGPNGVRGWVAKGLSLMSSNPHVCGLDIVRRAICYDTAHAANLRLDLDQYYSGVFNHQPELSICPVLVDVVMILTRLSSLCTNNYEYSSGAYMSDAPPAHDSLASCMSALAVSAPSPLILKDITIGCIDVHHSNAFSLGQLIIDTGSTGNLINDSRCIINPSAHTERKIAIRTGNAVSYSQSIGPATFMVKDNAGNDVELELLSIYCPTFLVNLFSPPFEYDAHQTIVEFDSRLRIITKDGTIIPITKQANSYRLYYEPPGVHANTANTDVAQLWHHRLGHPPFSVLRLLPSKTIGASFDLSMADAKNLQDSCCVCPHANMKAAPHRRNKHPDKLVSAFGDRVHLDLSGPLVPSNPHGYQYASIFVDEYSLHLGAYCIVRKSDQSTIHKSYCADMASYGGMSISEFHSDNGGEYTDAEYLNDIREQGARKTTIVARSPNQNPLAEGAFWKLFSIVRACLIGAKLPKNLWAFAYMFAAYVLNRLPRISRSGVATSTYEILNSRQPNINHIRVFGCVAHALVDKVDRHSKLDAIAVTGIHLGPARYKRGWHIWIPNENRFIVARTVRFDEKVLYGNAASTMFKSMSISQDDDSSDDDGDPIPPAQRGLLRPRDVCRTPGCNRRLWHLGPCGAAAGAPAAGLPSANLRSRSAAPNAGVAAAPVAPQAAAHVVQPQANANVACTVGEMPIHLFVADYYDGITNGIESYTALHQSEQQLHEPPTECIEAHAAVKAVKLVKEGGDFVQIPIPKTIRDVWKSPDRRLWQEAMDKEIDCHRRAGTWELVPAASCRSGRKPVGSTWAFDVKRNADGTISRYKARLCAQGFSQIEGWDFNITYSNTIRLDTVRLLLAIAAMKKLKLTGIDIVTAYLNGTLEEVIHMRQPPGFEEQGSNGEPMVCRLVKSIYGLKQSGKCWETRLLAELKKIGFCRCDYDPCLFRMTAEAEIIYIGVYVDDLIIASSTDQLRESVVDSLKQAFEVKDTGLLTWILGSAIHQDLVNDTVSLDQLLYIEDIMQTFLPEEIKSPKKGRSLPCNETILHLTNDTKPQDVHPLYRKIVGKLLWLVMVSRFDLAFAVSVLGRFNACGGAPHMEVALQVVRYAYCTRHFKVTYGPGRSTPLFNSILKNSGLKEEALSETSILFFSDASQGGSKPMAGYLGYLFGGPFAWAGFRLPLTSLSSCEGEYVAATKATCAILPLKQVKAFLVGDDDVPVILLVDNMAAVQLSENNTSSKRLKHIATRIAFLREAVEDKKIQLHHIKTIGQIADIFTKPLPAAQFHYLRQLVMP